jgi:NAD(P)-dependent dehydrogenase (short-subunit alcohol dehydrogenase family)
VLNKKVILNTSSTIVNVMLDSAESCRQFLEFQDPSIIASQIRKDEEQCRGQRLPSILALYLPSAHTKSGEEIAAQLCPSSLKYSRALRMAQYTGIVRTIKDYIQHMGIASQNTVLPGSPGFHYDDALPEPSQTAIQHALSVLDFYIKNDRHSGSKLRDDTPLKEVVEHLQRSLRHTQQSNVSTHPTYLKATKIKRKCYICQFHIQQQHSQYASLCKACGDFNLASCKLSLPKNLPLHGKKALVTGGRINLGYHTALRLLRCGAQVIVSTRYPADAESRYFAEPDAHKWLHALRIVGADFRTASDVFHLVGVTKEILKSWDENGIPKLDILINNAAQTLTDSVEKENLAIGREQTLLEEPRPEATVLAGISSYKARIRGGMAFPSHLLSHSEGTSPFESYGTIRTTNEPLQDPQQIETSYTDLSTAVSSPPKKSSWMQTLSEIPYEDMISAHSINTFVPLILIRELLPIMGSPIPSDLPPLAPNPQSGKTCKPLGHIINVSSREGLFEYTPSAESKNGHHVHTNVTKAALNMITQTESGPVWKGRRVAMNSVDPGYMSAAPEIVAKGMECPINWTDGAARVMWPIVVGEREEAVWGRFLKHFGAGEVNLGI